MRTAATVTTLALMLGLAACEAPGERDQEAGTMTGGADTGVMAGMDTMNQTGGMGAASEFELRSINNSGVTGRVTLTPSGNQTSVTLTLEGTDAAQRHLAHIHTGTCENIGNPVAPLDSLMSSGGQAGVSSTTLVPIDIATLGDGNHVVAAHEAGGTPGRPVVCAAIPAAGGAGTGMTGADTAAGRTGDTAGTTRR